MSDVPNPDLANVAECLHHLRKVMQCLDKLIEHHSEYDVKTMTIATAHLQMVIDLLDEPEAA